VVEREFAGGSVVLQYWQVLRRAAECSARQCRDGAECGGIRAGDDEARAWLRGRVQEVSVSSSSWRRLEHRTMARRAAQTLIGS